MAAHQDILIGQELVAMRLANQNLEQRLAMDVQFVEATNDRINEFNARTLPVLKAITGQDLGAEPEKWKSWWTDQLGYAYESNVPATKPTYSDFVSVAGAYTHSACFAAGTLVQTIDGPRPIESIRVGDRVLSQGTSTGKLAFQPVVATHRTPSNPTLRIAIGGETIVATGIHRFWKAGKGWTMARDLKAGDRLRVLGGTSAIKSIANDQNQPVYNLDVARESRFLRRQRAACWSTTTASCSQSSSHSIASPSRARCFLRRWEFNPGRKSRHRPEALTTAAALCYRSGLCQEQHAWPRAGTSITS